MRRTQNMYKCEIIRSKVRLAALEQPHKYSRYGLYSNKLIT